MISNTKANGKYQVNEDTLVLNFFIKNTFFNNAYLLDETKGWIEPMKKAKGYWQIDNKSGAGLMTIKNELMK